MSILTIRPNATVANGGGTTATGGAATRHGNTSDDTNTSYVTVTSSTSYSNPMILDLGAVTGVIPANTKINQVRVRARVAVNPFAFNYGTLYIRLEDSSGIEMGPRIDQVFSNNDSTIYDLSSPWYTKDQSQSYPYGPWTAAELDGARIQVDYNYGSNQNTRIYELYVDIDYEVLPVVGLLTPTGVIPVSSVYANWIYTSDSGSPQSSTEIKVFNAAQYGAGGFDPSTSPYVQYEVSSGQGTSFLLGPLPNDVYRVYIRSASQSGAVSAWTYSAFTVAAYPIGTNDLYVWPTEATDFPGSQVKIGLAASLNALQLQDSTADSTAGTWASGANATVVRTTTAGEYVSGGAGIRITSVAAGAVVGQAGSLATSPVEELQTYKVDMQLKANVGRNVNIGIRFYTSAGVLLTDETTTVTLTTAFQRFQTAGFVAPATGAYVMVYVGWTAAAAGEIVYVDEISANSRAVVNLFDDHDNQDSFFESAGVGGWVAQTNANTPTRTTTAGQYRGPASVPGGMVLTSTGAGDAIWRCTTLIPATDNIELGMRAWVKAAATGRAIQFGMRYLDKDLVQLGADVFGAAGNSTTAGGECYTTALSDGPAGTVWAQMMIKVVGTAGSETHYVDEIIPFNEFPSEIWGQGGVDPHVVSAAPYFEVEYSDDGGTTWLPLPWVSTSDDSPSATPLELNQTGFVYDWTLAPGQSRSYRVRTTASVSGGSVSTDWRSVSYEMPSYFSDAKLVNPLTEDVVGIHLESFVKNRVEPQSVSYPFGRTAGVAQTLGPKGHVFSLGLRTENRAEHDALVDLLDQGVPLLLSLPIGEIYWIKVQSDVQFEHIKAQPLPTEDTPVRHLYRILLQAVEVVAPVRVA